MDSLPGCGGVGGISQSELRELAADGALSPLTPFPELPKDFVNRPGQKTVARKCILFNVMVLF